jgi:hypothetical protein
MAGFLHHCPAFVLSHLLTIDHSSDGKRIIHGKVLFYSYQVLSWKIYFHKYKTIFNLKVKNKLCVCVCVCMHAGVHRGQRHQIFLDLELQMVMTQPEVGPGQSSCQFQEQYALFNHLAASLACNG